MPTITNRIPNPANAKRRKVLGVTHPLPFPLPAGGAVVPPPVGVVDVGPTSVGATVGDGVGLGVGDGVGEGAGVGAAVTARMLASIPFRLGSLSAIALTD